MLADVPCPSDQTISFFVNRGLADDDARAVRVHVDRCAACRELVSELAQDLLDTAESVGGSDSEPARSSIGRYRVDGLIGAGASGVVYAAWDPELNRHVAIKVLVGDWVTDADRPARLRREAQAMARLSHPNVVSVHDVGTLDGRVFMAMELVEGSTLTRWRQERTRHWREVVGVFLLAGRGLAAAHEAGLVHRDFKPDNILVGSDGRVCVTDFGLARETHGERLARSLVTGGRFERATCLENLTQSGLLVGTPAYMAPEQGEGHPVDPRADQFSFCVSLYESLFGVRPFARMPGRGPVPREAIARMGADVGGARVPAGIRHALLRGLSVDPAERYASMEALLADLERCRRPALLRWFSRSGRGLRVLVVLALASASIGAAALARSGHRASARMGGHARPSLAVAWIRNDTNDASLDWLEGALTEALRGSLQTDGLVRVIDDTRVVEMASEPSLAADTTAAADRLRLALGSDCVIRGRVSRGGPSERRRLRVQVELVDGQAGPLVIDTEFLDDDVVDASLRVANRIRAHMYLPLLAASGTTAVRALMPAHTDGLRAFGDGVRSARQGRWSEAARSLERATVADPDSLAAHLRFAAILDRLGHIKSCSDEAARAATLAAPLPEAARLPMEARALELARDPLAIDRRRDLFRRFPDDADDGLRLAEALTDSGDAPGAAVALRVLRALEDSPALAARLDLAEARAARAREDWAAMEAAAHAALDKAGEDLVVLARARMFDAEALSRLQRFEPALFIGGEARRLYAELPDRLEEARAVVELGSVQAAAGQLDASVASLEEGVALAIRAGDAATPIAALEKAARIRRGQGDLGAAVDLYARALQLAQDADDAAARLKTLESLAVSLTDSGRFDEAKPFFEQAKVLLEASGKRGELGRLRSTLAVALLEGLRLPEAKATFEETLAVAREDNDEQGEGYALAGLGAVAEYSDDLVRARTLYEQWFTLALHQDLGTLVKLALAILAVEDGRFADGEALARAAAQQLSKVGAEGPDPYAQATLAWALFEQGKVAEATAAVAGVRDRLRPGDVQRLRLHVATVTAAVDGASGDPERVRAAFAELEAIRGEAARTGSRKAEIWARYAVGRVELASGRPQARATLAAVERDARSAGLRLVARLAARAARGAARK